MLLVTFSDGERMSIGALDRQRAEIVDLCAAAPQLPPSMLDFIALGTDGLEAARQAMGSGQHRLKQTQVRLLAPIPRPARNIFCLGKNYLAHAHEVRSIVSGGGQESAVPKHPVVFTKAPSCVIGPGESIPIELDPTDSVDYEGEFTVVIGAGGRAIRRAAAMTHVFGYTLINDVTSRTLQRQHLQWFLGKSLDGFCPMGPVIATADEVADVRELQLQTRVNQELRQNGSVGDLIFDIPTLIETLSGGMTLEPGDLIATGTPAGVGAGFDPPRFLNKGDTVEITVEPIGTLSNRAG